MCDPLTIAAATMSTLSAVQGHQAQKQAHLENKANALQAQSDELRQINVQQAQEDTKAAQEKIANDLAVREQVSRANVAGDESGASLNNNAVVQDMRRQGLVANTMTGQNLENTMQNLQEERLGSKTRAISRINQVAKPSSTATALQIASGGIAAAQAGGYGGKK